jgi:outer membrane protein assembly factor BamD (BamD/ComL family)
MAIMVEAYEKLGMRDLADDTRRVLSDNYPEFAVPPPEEKKKRFFFF